MIAIIDYGAGNLQSVKNALDFLKADSIITSNAREIIKAKKIIFPGVGSFGNMMRALNENDIIEPIIKAIDDNKPFLGICLGMQALFEKSDESPKVRGLSIFEGKCKKLDANLLEIKKEISNFDLISNIPKKLKNENFSTFFSTIYAVSENLGLNLFFLIFIPFFVLYFAKPKNI